jgi:hypothetical protein
MRKKKRWVSKDVLEACVERTAAELLEVSGGVDDNEGTMAALRAEARERVKGLYRMGICDRCSGPASRCAPRHAEGRSCA